MDMMIKVVVVVVNGEREVRDPSTATIPYCHSYCVAINAGNTLASFLNDHELF